MPSGYEPTRELLPKRMFFGGSACSKREEKVLQYVIDRMKKDVPRANARASRPRARGSEQEKVIPYATLIYDVEGKAFTYTAPQPLTFVRKEIEIDRVDGDSVVLSDSRLLIDRKWRRRAAAACAGLVLIAAGVVSLSACGSSLEEAYPETASHHEPAKLEPIKGTDVKRVIFSAEGAKRVGLQTAPIRQNGEEKIMPYAALIYDAEGNTYVYTAPQPLTFVRKEIEIDHLDGDSVVLSDGPPAGTKVVTVGVDEVYGTEFEVAE